MGFDILSEYRPSSDLLRDRVILVTGAGDGIGRAVSKAYAAHGASVILLGKTVNKLEAVYDEIEQAGHPQPAIYPMDLRGATEKDYDELSSNVEREFGRLDGLLNNAGWIGVLAPFKFYDARLWAEVLTVNLHAPFLLTRACLRLLEQANDPAIIFSTHECRRAYWGAYGIAKAGQAAMLQILADEYDGERPIRVNGVDTGPVRTALRRLHYPGEDPNQHPAPEQVTLPYLYFIGPDSRGVTGKNVSLQESLH